MGEKENTKYFQILNNPFNLKFVKFITTLDYQITRNLKDAKIETRSTKSNGLWCCVLLPTVLIVNTFISNVTDLYRLVAYLSVGLLFYSVLFIIFISISCLVLKEPIYGGCTASSLTSALLVYIFLGQDLLFSLIFSIPAVFLYTSLLRVSLTKFPNTFTIGEAMIVMQSIVLCCAVVLAKVFFNIGDVNTELQLVSVLLYTGLSTVGLIVTALCFLRDEQRNLRTFGYIMAAAVAYGLLVLHVVLGTGCILNILNYIFMNQIRAQLFTFWLSLLLIAVFIINIRTRMAVKASTVMRKSFHVLAAIVFLSGIVCDVYLMVLAAGAGFGLLVLIEALRISRIEPISSALQSAFLVYSDEKDGGYFAMTPLYLYCALACPLLLVPVYEGHSLELLSGVLSIGVGDTAASWFGSRYGSIKWPNSSRTIEGTLFNILSQVVTVYFLQVFELLESNNALLRILVAATMSGLVEAKTEQVDNLILPLTTIFGFQITWVLA